MNKVLLTAIMLTLSASALSVSNNPYGKGYHQTSNPYGKGYVQNKGLFNR